MYRMHAEPVVHPTFLTLCFEDVDHAGHAYGPDSAQTTQAVAHVDEVLGRFAGGTGRSAGCRTAEAPGAHAVLAKGSHAARFQYGQNPRVPGFICLAEVGWQIAADARAAEGTPAGAHGYGNMTVEIQAIFNTAGRPSKAASYWRRP